MLKEEIEEFVFRRVLEEKSQVKNEEEQEKEIQLFKSIEERLGDSKELLHKLDEQKNFSASIEILEAYKKGFRDSFKLFIRLYKENWKGITKWMKKN